RSPAAPLTETQKSWEALRRMPPQKMWQTPCASMMLGVEAEDALEFLWFGDCAALVQQGDGPVTIIGDTLDKRAAEAGRAAKVAKEKNKPSTERANFLDSLRASRNRINSGDAWLFSPDVQAASHVSRRLVKA